MSLDDTHVNWTTVKGYLSVNGIRFFESPASVNSGKEAYADVTDMVQAQQLMDMLRKVGVESYIRSGQYTGKPPRVVVSGEGVEKLSSNITLTPLPMAVASASTLLGAAGSPKGLGVEVTPPRTAGFGKG
ncbi:MAG: hypothetical protein ACN2B6_05845 [Rickettsiales bacterium]